MPFLPWARGVRNNGEGHIVYDSFELTKVGMDLRILAYLIMGVGLVGVVAGLVILFGPSGLRLAGAVVASLFAYGLAMAIGASYAFAQAVVFVFPQLLAAGEGGYSVPPALTALAIATVLILGGATVLLRTRLSPQSVDGLRVNFMTW